MSHYALQIIANDRYIALREEADQSRLRPSAPAVPSAPPAAIRRLAGRIVTLVLTRVTPLGVRQHLA